VSQLFASRVPPSSTIPGVEARGITYVTFSDLAIPDIRHDELRPPREIKKLFTCRGNCYALLDVWCTVKLGAPEFHVLE
jgi:hypothetical protein